MHVPDGQQTNDRSGMRWGMLLHLVPGIRSRPRDRQGWSDRDGSEECRGGKRKHGGRLHVTK